MALLTWLPYDMEEWDRRVRELHLSLADEGALHRLIRGAWQADVPCTIADTPDEFARILGAQWRKALPIIRAHFEPLSDQPKRLRCAWLHDLYLRQLEKHLSYQSRGKKGGRPKAEPEAQIEAELEAEPKAELPENEAELSQSSTEAISSAPTGHRANSPATAGALAPVGATPRATAARQLAPTADSVRQRKALQDEYFTKLRGKAESWFTTHPVEAAEFERLAREEARVPASGELEPFQQRAVRAGMHQQYRALKRLPTCDEYLDTHLSRTATPIEREAVAMGGTP